VPTPLALLRVLGVTGLIAMLCGCPDPNIYGTPRTLAPGDFQLQASESAYAGAVNGARGLAPAPPSLGGRYGVVDRFDVGARIVDFSALAGDAKYNFVRGRVDLAIDPRVEFYVVGPGNSPTAHVGVIQGHLPLLLGINFDEATTLVLVPGVIGTTATAGIGNIGLSAEQVAFASSGLGAQLGVGLNVHQSDKVSWQPEVTVWHDFNAVGSWVCVFGIGLNLGAQPDYSDLAPAE
jgi:hypothetical protein